MERTDHDGVLPRLGTADELARSGAPAADGSTGEMRAKLANAMVGLKKEHYGRGPTAAKAWLLDDYVFVVLEGGLTRNEETLLAAGEVRMVRDYRLTFQQVVRDQFTTAVERITGRKVLDYHSQIVFDPPRSFEFFVLDGPPDGASDEQPS
jgi:uncharacterized protein YbcI